MKHKILDSVQSAESDTPISQHLPFSPTQQILGAAEALTEPLPSQPSVQSQKEQPHPRERHRAAPQQFCFIFLDTAQQKDITIWQENPDFGVCYWTSKSRAAGAECQTHRIVFCCSTLEQLCVPCTGPSALSASSDCPDKAEGSSTRHLLWSFLVLIRFVTPKGLVHRQSSFYSLIQIPLEFRQIWQSDWGKG